jgi:hypothetical protein
MTLADVFSTDYGFNIGAGGLAYLGLGVGFTAASLFGAKFGSEMYKRVSVAVIVIPNFFLIIFPSLPKRMEELESQRCAFRRYVLVPCWFLLVYCKDVTVTYIVDTINFKRRWYGWSAEAKLHWMMPIVGTGIYGFGEFCANETRRCWLISCMTH